MTAGGSGHTLTPEGRRLLDAADAAGRSAA